MVYNAKFIYENFNLRKMKLYFHLYVHFFYDFIQEKEGTRWIRHEFLAIEEKGLPMQATRLDKSHAYSSICRADSSPPILKYLSYMFGHLYICVCVYWMEEIQKETFNWIMLQETNTMRHWFNTVHWHQLIFRGIS